MTEKTAFQVTEKAGNFVAGRRSPGAGNTLPLTAEEAHHALMLGEIVPADQRPVVKTKATKPAADTAGSLASEGN